MFALRMFFVTLLAHVIIFPLCAMKGDGSSPAVPLINDYYGKQQEPEKGPEKSVLLKNLELRVTITKNRTGFLMALYNNEQMLPGYFKRSLQQPDNKITTFDVVAYCDDAAIAAFVDKNNTVTCVIFDARKSHKSRCLNALIFKGKRPIQGIKLYEHRPLIRLMEPLLDDGRIVEQELCVFHRLDGKFYRMVGGKKDWIDPLKKPTPQQTGGK